MPMIVTKGSAKFTAGGLRCTGAYPRCPDRPCGKLLVRFNSVGALCGNFLCPRCHQIIEVVNS